MKSVIAIVGRPNVGKSTLFNFLTRSRNALVADRPGVTRDRQYGFGNYQGREFILVDTGGLGRNDKDSENISNLISDQSLRAIEEADVLIWLVDGREGLTAEDEHLAEILRPMCDHIFLSANKTEGLDTDIVLSDFHRFGFNEPSAISAKRGDGVSHLMDEVIKQLPIESDNEGLLEHGLRITVLGRPNVGKSTLTNRILGEERMLTFDQPGTTRDSIAIPFERDGIPYTLIDTAGIRRRSKINDAIEKFSVVKSLQAIDSTQIVVLVLDAHEAVTEQDATLLGLIADSGKALIIAVNKWDGLEISERTRIKAQLDRKLGFIDYACVHFISALHGSGVGKLFVSINKISKSISIDPSASKITAILQEATQAHSPPLVRGRRIKLRYAHIGGHDPIRIIVHGNQTDRVPESYKRYLANQMRKQLKLVGAPVLIEFKQGENPYKNKKNILSNRQIEKRRRLMRHVKKN
ncbi:MAG: ribosome biogenesis GTPase Der [Gammaproteobacteria bacterium]|nr:ribosome biogenesis GTPase Der [Gammaproteobacteria bacterium]